MLQIGRHHNSSQVWLRTEESFGQLKWYCNVYGVDLKTSHVNRNATKQPAIIDLSTIDLACVIDTRSSWRPLKDHYQFMADSSYEWMLMAMDFPLLILVFKSPLG